MLKHEEMIENVHRRIAQYEEEKKMKHSKFKNIFSAKESTDKNNEEYTEVVSGIETVNSSNRMVRIVSTMAASAVLITGLGTTGYLLHKNKSNTSGLPEDIVAVTQSNETSEVVDYGLVSPFADFRQIYFGISEINNYDFPEYSDATYDKLAVFLNNFNWGEGSGIAEKDIPDFDNYEGIGYGIGWRKGDVWFYVYVTEEGKAYYLTEKCTPDGNCYEYPIIASSVFNIDYATFDKGIQDILEQ